ncbi:hypothetical protein ACFWN7_13260 [Agromyces sp. NPDC058484]|uniref:hypothetical protein n=1 Tax=Agromyces sp. NPDC058484 TaxID=3346524 RepID=UPI00365EF2C8
MTEPQVWTLIGVFSALMIGMLTVVSALFVRVVRSEIGGLRGELGGLRGELGGLRGEFGGLRAELKGEIGGLRGELGGLRGELMAEIGALRSEMNARFEVIDQKLGYLDRDVQLLMSREFGSDRG